MGYFFFQAEDGIRDLTVTGVQTCALPILGRSLRRADRVRAQPDVLRSQPAPRQSLRTLPGPQSTLRALVVLGLRRGRRARVQSPVAAGKPRPARKRGRRLHRGDTLRKGVLPRRQAASRDSATPAITRRTQRLVSARRGVIAGVAES